MQLNAIGLIAGDEIQGPDDVAGGLNQHAHISVAQRGVAGDIGADEITLNEIAR